MLLEILQPFKFDITLFVEYHRVMRALFHQGDLWTHFQLSFLYSLFLLRLIVLLPLIVLPLDGATRILLFDVIDLFDLPSTFKPILWAIYFVSVRFLSFTYAKEASYKVSQVIYRFYVLQKRNYLLQDASTAGRARKCNSIIKWYLIAFQGFILGAGKPSSTYWVFWKIMVFWHRNSAKGLCQFEILFYSRLGLAI